mmetsp:Transcript_32099/g.77633  ORF Transcript_32099/g.77633 Transcript_32099/m.77633 type:complete len:90 (-) Transcript_32099:468-737(-)
MGDKWQSCDQESATSDKPGLLSSPDHSSISLDASSRDFIIELLEMYIHPPTPYADPFVYGCTGYFRAVSLPPESSHRVISLISHIGHTG